MGDGLHWGQPLECELRGPRPVTEGPLLLPRLGVVVGEHLRPGVHHLGEPSLQDLGDMPVELPPAAARKGPPRHLLEECMVELVARLGGVVLLEDSARHQLLEVPAQLGLAPPRERGEQGSSEAAPHPGTKPDQRPLPGRERVEPARQ